MQLVDRGTSGTGKVEYRRRDVNPTYHRFTADSGCSLRRADDQRRVDSLIVEGCLGSRECPAVIRYKDDECVIFMSTRLDLRQHQDDTGIYATAGLVVQSKIRAYR